MQKEKTQSYRLWTRAVKALRKVERERKLDKNLSKTILFLAEYYTASTQVKKQGVGSGAFIY